MASHAAWEVSQEEGPIPPEEIAEHFAAVCGYRNGYYGMDDEGRAYLASPAAYVRRAFIREFHDGFIDRKYRDGEISRGEWFFYSPAFAWDMGLRREEVA